MVHYPLTGKGHAIDLAILLGLSGSDPEYIPTNEITPLINLINTTKNIMFSGTKSISFYPQSDIIFNREFLPFHANGMKFTGFSNEIEISSDSYYSIGGGFVVREELIHPKENI